MKKLLTLSFLTLLCANSFAKTCVVLSGTEDSSDYTNRLATYEDVESNNNSIVTLIKNNGEVHANFDMASVYFGVQSQAEIDARTEDILGSQVAIISKDSENNQLTLSIGKWNKAEGDVIESSTMSISDLTSSKAAVFDTKQKLAIYCIDQ